MGKSVSLYKITVLAFISFLAITLITLFKNALELEDAEQAYYSQWLRWGYDDQPPLYTWLQYGVNKIFGINRISFSFLRGILFAGILLFLYRFSVMRIKDVDKSKLAILLLVLIPVFIDFTFRRLSHTSLLCFSIIGTYYCIQLMIRKKSFLNYLLFGAFVGVGLLSKYNYIFFLISFILVSVWDKELRCAVCNPKILVSILVSLLLIAPHSYWLIGPEGFESFLQESVKEKVGNDKGLHGFTFVPVLVYLKGLLSLSFMILVLLVIAYYLKILEFKKPSFNWFPKMLLVQLLILGLFFLIFQSPKVETRWLLPLCIPFTILLLESVELKRSNKLVTIGFWLFYAVILIQTIRTPIEKLLEIPSSVHFGFQPVANKLSSKYIDYQWVLPNVTYAGNVRLLHPEKIIFSTDDYSLSNKNNKNKESIKVSIDKSINQSSIAVDSIIGFGKEKENLYFYIN